VSSLLAILPASLALSKPSTPTFTIIEISSPYDIPPIYTINPYTGENKLYSAGVHVENKTTYIKIKNQPFTQDPDNNLSLYYQLRFKGHYLPDEDYYSWQTADFPDYLIAQSDSEYTFMPFNYAFQMGDQVDIQVRAVIGGYYIHNMYGFNNPQFSGDSYSDWSRTQTLTIGSPPSSTVLPSTSNPTNLPQNTLPSNINPSTPNQPNTDKPDLFGLVSWVGVALVVLFSAIVVLLAIIVVYLRKKSVTQFDKSLDSKE
jgi:hypothetical protein